MKRYLFSTGLLALSAGLFSANALADSPPFGDGGAALQGVLDSITTAPAGASSVNVATDALSDALDSQWQIGGSGGAISTLVIEIASFAGSNTFGVYDFANSANSVQVFDGVASTGSQKLLSIMADGSVIVNFVDTGIDFAGNNFGFYLDANIGNNCTAPDCTWYSDTVLNKDGFDHMGAYQGVGDTIQIGGFAAGPWGSNEYILAWEDLNGGGDKDFTDFVVLVESVSPVPIPPAALLFGSALVGIAGIARRRSGTAA